MFRKQIPLFFSCFCLLLLSACGGSPDVNADIKLTDAGVYTFTAVDYAEKEGPRISKPGGRGSVPGEKFYYAVMESEECDYRFYEAVASMDDALRAVNGNLGVSVPLTLEIQIYTDESSGGSYFFDSGTDSSQALQQIQEGTYRRRETLE